MSFFQVQINSPFYMIQYSEGKKVVQVSAKKVLFDRFYAKSQRSFRKPNCSNVFSLFILDCVKMYIVRVHERGEEGVGLYCTFIFFLNVVRYCVQSILGTD